MNKIKLEKSLKPHLVHSKCSIIVSCYYNKVKSFMTSAISTAIFPLRRSWKTGNNAACPPPQPLFCLLEASWMTGDLRGIEGQPGILRIRFLEGRGKSPSHWVTTWMRNWKQVWWGRIHNTVRKPGIRERENLVPGWELSQTSLLFQMLPGKTESNAACPLHSQFCFSFGALCRAESRST